MNKLNIFVCENYSPEFQSIIDKEGFDDNIIKPYPCMCENKNKKADAEKLLVESISNEDKGLILCSNYCDIIKLVPEDSSFEIRSANYCLSHFANEQLIEYILAKGGYVIGSGWLNNWREHIQLAGFDKDTARCFYKEFCKELIFFDTGINANSEKNLKALSEFLELPYVSIKFEIDTIKVLIKSAIYEWRLHKITEISSKIVSDVQSQCAEYAAILDLIGKISAYTNKREIIEKIKEIFTIILGAQQFKYWNSDYEKDSLPDEINELFENNDELFLLFNEENRFCIKIEQNDKSYGAIDASGFLFPKYIEKYLNFAIEIVKVCGLVLTNIEQYEKLLKSEKELQYLSFHDSLTGLFNRTYLNEMLNINKDSKYLAVFMFDIDKLKYVNDNFGHAEGDKLICSASDILKKCFRETDTVARIGGDEFLSILPECDFEMAELFKNRINKEINIHNSNIQEAHLALSVSIGFAVSENNIDTLENIMKKADELMYVEKIGKTCK
jgi:diguanylate cyclase (GGDEF)-like protein